MFIEILNNVVRDIIAAEGNKKELLEIKLTPFIYKSVQLELNDKCKFKTEVPIESVEFMSVTFYKRSIKLTSCGELDSKFEKRMVEEMMKHYEIES